MRLIYTLCAGRLAGDSAGGDHSGISIFLFAVFLREARKNGKTKEKSTAVPEPVEATP
jgi:hypothetical protein